jgi:hypothetical protein
VFEQESPPVEGDSAMKIIHGSLTALLHEVKERSVEVVRVAAFLQGSDVVSNGIPRYTA